MSLISYVTRIHFGDAVLEDAVEAELETLGLGRPMVVTDGGVVAAGLADRLLAAVRRPREPVVFAREAPAPTERSCLAAASLYRERRCDGLIALGGGSTIDLAKALRVRLTHPGPLARYAAIEGGTQRIHDGMPALLAVPTTAGSGGEVSGATSVAVEDGRRLGLVSRFLVPTVAILDPTATLPLPAGLTAATGMGALALCLETFLASAYNPPADGIALDGARRAARHIERAVADGDDLDARREMMAAALNGGLALQKGTGGVQAMSLALAGSDGQAEHYGALSAVLLPHMLAFNAPAVGDRYPEVMKFLGWPAAGDLPGAVARLAERLKLPTRLRELGLDEPAIRTAAPRAEADHANRTNPRRATAADYGRIMRAAL